MKQREASLLIIFAVMVVVYGWDFWKGESTAYFMQCKDRVSDGYCATPARTIGVTTYKAFPEQQVVVSRAASSQVQRWEKCVVSDKENWRCKYNDELGEFGFKNGTYFEQTLKIGIPELQELVQKNVCRLKNKIQDIPSPRLLIGEHIPRQLCRGNSLTLKSGTQTHHSASPQLCFSQPFPKGLT